MITYASAPNRILGIGSWTDTAFAEHGAVLNCAINYSVQVVIQPRARTGVAVCPRKAGTEEAAEPIDKLACLAHDDTLRAVARQFGITGVEAYISYNIPPGGGLGTTAAVAVALTGALAHYAGCALDPHQVAVIAHRLHCEELGRVCGMHSFMAAAFGGLALYEFTPYPRVFATPLTDIALQQALTDRLVLVQLPSHGAGNCYAHLAQGCRAGEHHVRKALWELRTLPAQALEALRTRDFTALGAVMHAQLSIQQNALAGLISPSIRRVHAIARANHALGLMVNGTGGSITALCDPAHKAALMEALRRAGYRVLPVAIDHKGLQVWSHHPTEQYAPVPLLRNADAA
ncbi:MAG: GHMP family kinase ATP-binding protein [Armatimonadota bacterium]